MGYWATCHHHYQWYIMYKYIYWFLLLVHWDWEKEMYKRGGNASLAYLLNLLGEVRQPVSVWVLAAGMDWSNWWRWRLPALVWVSPCHLQPRPRHLHHLTSSNHHHPASLDQDSHFHIDHFNSIQFWSRSVKGFFCTSILHLKMLHTYVRWVDNIDISADYRKGWNADSGRDMTLCVCCDFTFSTKIQTLLLAFVLLLHRFTLIKCNFENSEDREDARSQDSISGEWTMHRVFFSSQLFTSKAKRLDGHFQVESQFPFLNITLITWNSNNRVSSFKKIWDRQQ